MFDNRYGIIVPSFKEGYSDTLIKALVKKKYYEEEISEKIRLFYVALTRCKEKMIVVADIKDDEVVELTDAFKENYRSFLDILNSVRDKLEDYLTFVNLDNIGISKDYLSKDIVKELKLNDSKKIEVNEFIMDNEEIEDSHFSKTISKLITKEEKDNLKFGTLIHELFEIVDFKNPDLDNLNVSDNYKKYITNFLEHDLLSHVKEANILKEYEFYTKDKHGIIDLVLEYDDHIDIIDYKLKHIDDPFYVEQLTGYKDYIESKTKKETNIYLYSILDNKFNKIK
jgi:ATP-dependent helicase/nuclease subunit A